MGKLNKILLASLLFTNLFSEKFMYKVYMKFPYWVQIGTASYKEKSDTLEGKIELGGFFNIIASLTPLKNEYCYKTINNGSYITYYENEKKYILHSKEDILSIINYIRIRLKRNERLPKIFEVFMLNKRREINIYYNGEIMKVEGLPIIKKIKAYNFYNGAPQSIESSVFGIKFKGELIKDGYKK